MPLKFLGLFKKKDEPAEVLGFNVRQYLNFISDQDRETVVKILDSCGFETPDALRETVLKGVNLKVTQEVTDYVGRAMAVLNAVSHLSRYQSAEDSSAKAQKGTLSNSANLETTVYSVVQALSTVFEGSDLENTFDQMEKLARKTILSESPAAKIHAFGSFGRAEIIKFLQKQKSLETDN